MYWYYVGTVHLEQCEHVKFAHISSKASHCNETYVWLGLAADVALLLPQHHEGGVQAQHVVLGGQVALRCQEQQATQCSSSRQEAALLGLQGLQQQ